MPRVAHLRSLTGLRFIAAFHVVAFHTAPRPAVPAILRPLVDTGYVGVSLFFVLSGFILAHTYGRAGPLAGRERSRFWQARFARVYPVYLVGLLVALPIFLRWVHGAAEVNSWPTAAGKIGVTAAANVLLLQAWITVTIAQWNSPGWTLSCEAAFYALFPDASRRLATLARGQLLLAVAAMAVAAIVPPLVYGLLDPHAFASATHASSGGWLSVLKFNPVLRLPEFLLGIALGRLFIVTPAMRSGSWLVGVGTLVAVGLLMMSGRIPYLLLHNGLLALPFAAIIYGLAQGGGVLDRMLGSSPAVLLGESSYALYILHVPLAWWARSLNLKGTATDFALLVALIVAVSIIVNRGIEEPLRRRLRPSRSAPAAGEAREPTALGGTAPTEGQGGTMP